MVEGFYKSGSKPHIEILPPIVQEDDHFFDPPAKMGQVSLVAHNEFLERPLPSSPESEKVILGGILMDNGFMEMARNVMAVDDFYSPLHRRVYAAMVKLWDKGDRIEPILIGEELRKEGQLENIGGVITIANLAMGLPRFSTIDRYVKVVKGKAQIRNLVKLLSELTSLALSEEDEPDTMLQTAETKMLALVTDRSENGREREGFYNLNEITPEMGNEFVALNAGQTTGVSTGMKEVDILLDGGGLQSGGLYLVAGAEKSGKTSLALDWAYNISAVQKLFSLIATFEMKKKTLAKRIYSYHTGIPYYMFRPGFRDTDEFQAFTIAMTSLDNFGTIPMAIADNLSNMVKVKKHFRRRVDEGHKPGNVPVAYGVVDYMQLVELNEDSGKMSQTEKVGKVSRELKLLANDLGIPIIAMSSLNRLGMGVNLNDKQEKMATVPGTHNLRDNNQLAFDAEAVFFVHNPAYIPGQPYIPQPVTDIQLILDRQRNGPTGIIQLKFIGEFMSFMTESQYAKYIAKGRTQAQETTLLQSMDDLWE